MVVESEAYQGKKKIPTNQLTYGFGINDADYQTQGRLPKSWKCEYKKRWDSLMQRCYSAQFQAKSPTYIGCSVDERWKSFMDFRAWMMTQDWEGKQLDKDLLFPGNKVYGPDTCVFVTQLTNVFTTGRVLGKEGFPRGVALHRGNKKFTSTICIEGRPTTLGYFNTPEEAHECWYEAKKKQSRILAQEQTDPRVAAALIARFP